MSQAWDIKINEGSPQLTAADRYGILETKLGTEAWHHLAFVFDRGRLDGYVDGVKSVLATDTFTTSPAAPLPTDDGNGISIGAVMPGGSDASCGCRLDDVRLYRRALDAKEITALAR
jgi:hypothetical protein